MIIIRFKMMNLATTCIKLYKFTYAKDPIISENAKVIFMIKKTSVQVSYFLR